MNHTNRSKPAAVNPLAYSPKPPSSEIELSEEACCLVRLMASTRHSNWGLRAYLHPQITDLFKDLYNATIIRNPDKVGFLGSG